jgi:glycosyltransferase involved in cell wall biosynthesis
MWQLSQRIGATIHEPKENAVLPIDKIRAKLSSTQPEQWALARALSEQLIGDDVILCPDENIGIAVGAICGAKRNRPKIVSIMHNVDRPRGRLALKLFRLAERVDVFITPARPQADFLRRYLSLPEARVLMWFDQTDTKFFTPGTASPDKQRPTIVSAGLEQRDYRTLAEATRDLNVDVKITGFSEYARPRSRTFPKTIPANMSRRFYDWLELVQLYRNADLVVLSLFNSKFAAGIQVLNESRACGRPVVVSQTQGLSNYLAPPGIVSVVNPGDPIGLRQAIVSLLNNPQEAQSQAQRGREWVLKNSNSDCYVENLATLLTQMR